MTLREQLAANGTSEDALGSSCPSVAPETFDEACTPLGDHEGCSVWVLQSGWLLEESSSGVAYLVTPIDLPSTCQDFAAVITRMIHAEVS